MTTYNKAVRDKIPQIIRDSGRNYSIEKLPDQEFLTRLEEKLSEELAEYMKDKSIEELADMLEVIYRIAELRGTSVKRLNEIRQEKSEKCGSFKDNIFLADAEKRV